MVNKFLYLIILFAITACNPKDNKDPETLDSVKGPELADLIHQEDSTTEIKNEKLDNLDVLVVVCSNGYTYANLGYDFNPKIESELNNFENINVLPFPYKKLMGVAYHGVFDKKYCKPIIDKIDVDYLVLTQFNGNYIPKDSLWGYDLRIVNTKTMEQVNSIHANGLKTYEAIEAHIQENIDRLKLDIEGLI